MQVCDLNSIPIQTKSKMSLINYRVHSLTSESENYPGSNLMGDGEFGWQSDFSPSYPQELNLQFYLPIKTKKLELTFHQYKIPSSIEVFIRMTKKESWRKLGFVIPNDNSQSNFEHQEIKTLYFEFPCSYVKLLFNQNYKNELNILEQVALNKISVYGEVLSRSEAQQWNLHQEDAETSDQQTVENQSEPSSIHPKQPNHNQPPVKQGLEQTSTTDEFLKQFQEVYRHLQTLKQEAVDSEDFQNAAILKKVILDFKQIQKAINELEFEKRQALEEENFDKCHRIKQEILKKKETFFYKKQQLLSNEASYISEHSYSRIHYDNEPIAEANPTDKKSDNIRDYFGTPEKQKRQSVEKSRLVDYGGQNNNDSLRQVGAVDHNSQVIPALRKSPKPQLLEYPLGDPRNDKNYIEPESASNVRTETKEQQKIKNLSSRHNESKNFADNASKAVSKNYSSHPMNESIDTSQIHQNNSKTMGESRRKSEEQNQKIKPSNNYSLPTERSEYEDENLPQRRLESETSVARQQMKSPRSNNLPPSPKKEQNISVVHPDDRPINPQRRQQLEELEAIPIQNDANEKPKGSFVADSHDRKQRRVGSHADKAEISDSEVKDNSKEIIHKYDLKPLEINVRLKLEHYFGVIREPFWMMIHSKNWKTKKDALEYVLENVRIRDKQSYMAALEFVSISIGDKHTQVVVSTLNLLNQIIEEGTQNGVTFSLAHLPYFVEAVMHSLLGLLTSTNKQLFEHAYNLYLSFGMVSFLSVHTLILTLIRYKQGSCKTDHKLMLNKFSLMISIVEKYAEATSKFYKDIVTWGTMFLEDPNNKVKNEASYLMLIMVDIVGEDKIINIIKTKPKALEALYTLLNSSSLMEPSEEQEQRSSKVYNQSAVSESRTPQEKSEVNRNKSKSKNDHKSSHTSKSQQKKEEPSSQISRVGNPWEEPSKYKEPVSSKNSIESPSQGEHTNIELEYSRESTMFKKNDRNDEYSENQQYSQNFESEAEMNALAEKQFYFHEQESEKGKRQHQELEPNDNICDFCFEDLKGVDQRTHLIRQCKIISCCEECYGRIYLREMTEHMMEECKYKEFHQQCKKCRLCFKVDEIYEHVAQGRCRPLKPGWQRCQFCFEDVEAHDMSWAKHAQVCTNLPEILSQEGDD